MSDKRTTIRYVCRILITLIALVTPIQAANWIEFNNYPVNNGSTTDGISPSSLAWSYNTGAAILTSPIFDASETAVYVSSNGVTRKIFYLNQTVAWTFTGDSGTETTPYLSSTHIYVGGGNKTYALFRNNGTIDWEYNNGNTQYSGIKSDGSRVFYANNNHNITALSTTQNQSHDEQLTSDGNIIGIGRGGGDVVYLSQSFSPNGSEISYLYFNKTADTGAPTDNVMVSLYQADANDLPTGSALKSEIVTDATWDSWGTGWNYINFAYNFTPNTKYVLNFSRTGALDAANFHRIAANVDNYSSGKAQYWDGAVWQDWAGFGGRDILFRTETAKGAAFWKYLAGGAGSIPFVWQIPALDTTNQTLYLGNNDNFVLYAINSTNGSLKWQKTLNNAFGGSPSIDTSNNSVYQADDSGVLTKINASTGATMWTFTVPDPCFTALGVCSNAVGGTAAIDSNNVYIGSDTSFIYAINKNTGALVWKFQTGNFVWSSIALSTTTNRLITGGYDHKIHMIDTATGTEVWNYTTSSNISTARPAVNGNFFAIGNDAGILYMFQNNSIISPVMSAVSPASYTIVPSGTQVQFSTTADQTLSSYHWTVDGSPVTGAATYMNSWAKGLHYIKVFGGNANGTSNTLEWRVTANRELAAAPVATANESRYTLLKNDTRNFDAQALVQNSILPYTDIIGTVFWLFVWLMIFAAYWIRQRQMTFPAVIALIFGGVIISTIPEQYKIFAQGLVAVGVLAVLYFMFTKKNE